MKNPLLSLIGTLAILTWLANPAYAQWNNIAPNNSGQSIKFVSPTTGYLQNIYTMQKSTDGGVTWTTIDSVSGSFSCTGMYWLNANEGFAVFSENLGFGNYAGWFKKTGNGGASWTTIQQVSATQELNAVWFTSSTTGYVVGGGGLIRKTTNGGNTWTTLSSTTTLDLYSVEFVNATTGWVGGDDGIILKTSNASTWTQQFSSIFYEFQDIAFTDPLNGCATGTYGLLRTTNGGASWNPVTVYGTYQFLSIDFPSADTGYMTGVGGNVFRTIDGGASWIGLNSIMPGYMVRDCDFITNDIGFVTIDFTGTWKTTNAGSGCPTLLVQNTVSMPDTIRSCAGSNAVFTAAASALNPYVFNVSPSWVWDTALSYGQYYYVNDSIANDTLPIIITMMDTTTNCGMLTDIVILITDSVTYQPLSQPTWLVNLCPGDSIVLDLGAGAEDGYFWQMSMDSTQTITVDTVGMYTGMAYACGNIYSYFFFVQWDSNCSQVCDVDAGPDTTFCQLQGQLNATPASPGNYTFSWSPAYGLDNPNVQNPNVVIGVNNQQYIVTMTDTANNCTATDTVVVSAYYWHIDTLQTCGNQPVTFDLGPGATVYTVQFTDTNGVWQTYNQTSPLVVLSQPVQYVCIGFYPGCGALTSVITLVDTCLCMQVDIHTLQYCGVAWNSVQFQPVISPASSNLVYSWTPSTGLSNPNIANPYVNNVINMNYTLTVTDTITGCVQSDTAQGVHVSNYVNDTVYSCNNQPVLLDAGVPFYQYFWNTGATSHAITVTNPGQYVVQVQTGNCFYTSIFTVIDSCTASVPNVWPGDCNYDLTANMADALHIGLAYGATGATRPAATNGWYAQPMTDWSQNYVNCNYKHGDTNGDGVIDVNDTLAISLNYGLNHPYQFEVLNPAPATAPTLELSCTVDTVGLQTLVQINVILGNATTSVDSLYGISFRITSDAGLIDTNLTAINANNSWLGTQGSDMFSFQKHFLTNAIVDFAEVRNNQSNVNNGSGNIATLFIVTTDNLSGIAVCDFTLSDVTAVTASQHYLQFNLVNDSVVIDPTVPAGIIETENATPLHVYPNPANDKVVVETVPQSQIQICDVTGRVVMTAPANSATTIINTASLATGTYVIRAINGNSITTQRLVIAR
ncbi:MAG: YCF48-related protein [Bacteroidia bacterium]|nr:YCF48-related protein [Bacteroidia bacterium]